MAPSVPFSGGVEFVEGSHVELPIAGRAGDKGNAGSCWCSNATAEGPMLYSGGHALSQFRHRPARRHRSTRG